VEGRTLVLTQGTTRYREVQRELSFSELMQFVRLLIDTLRILAYINII
jgi:hypothetical protein